MASMDEILEQMQEAVQDELACSNFAEWSLAISGANFQDMLNTLTARELRELSEELQEGRSLSLKVDISEAILAQVDEILESREEDDDDSDDEEYEEEDE